MLNFVWGRVGNPAASGFTLDDRSGTPVFVKTNAAAVSEGDYAEAEAVLHYSESGAILLAARCSGTMECGSVASAFREKRHLRAALHTPEKRHLRAALHTAEKRRLRAARRYAGKAALTCRTPHPGVESTGPYDAGGMAAGAGGSRSSAALFGVGAILLAARCSGTMECGSIASAFREKRHLRAALHTPVLKAPDVTMPAA
jgi:hypothetical protein